MDRDKLQQELEAKAPRYRLEIIEMLCEAGSGHPGGSLSAIDVISALYHYKLRHKPDQPRWPERDRLVLSKGHGVPAQYVVLSDLGYFPREQLWTLRKLGSRWTMPRLRRLALFLYEINAATWRYRAENRVVGNELLDWQTAAILATVRQCMDD